MKNERINTLNIFPSLRKSGKDGKYLVQITCSYRTKDGKHCKPRFSMGLKINPEDWDSFRKEPRAEFAINNQEWYAHFKSKIEQVSTAFTKAFEAQGKTPTSAQIRREFENIHQGNKPQKSIKNGMPKHLDEFIIWFVEKQVNMPYSKKLRPGTLKQYKHIYASLDRYYRETKTRILLSSVSMSDVDEYVSWMENRKKPNDEPYAHNTIKNHEKWLIACVNKAVQNKIKCPEWNPRASEGRMVSANTDDVYFDLLDIQKLMNYEPENSMEKTALVWAVIAFFTGIRVSDWKRMHQLMTIGKSSVLNEHKSKIVVEDVEYDFIHLRPTKTSKTERGNGLWAGIPILRPVVEIINKHGLPKPYSDQKLNQTLKTVAIKAGLTDEHEKKLVLAKGQIKTIVSKKGEFATTHKIGRTSFITLFANSVPKPILTKITAHSGGKKDAFDGYVKDLDLKRNAERFIQYLIKAQEDGEFQYVVRNGQKVTLELKLL